MPEMPSFFLSMNLNMSHFPRPNTSLTFFLGSLPGPPRPVKIFPISSSDNAYRWYLEIQFLIQEACARSSLSSWGSIQIKDAFCLQSLSLRGGKVSGVLMRYTKHRELHTLGQGSTEAQESGKPPRFGQQDVGLDL